VRVSEGYARNFLFPANSRARDRSDTASSGETQQVREPAEKKRSKGPRPGRGDRKGILHDRGQGGEGEKLFGSVTSTDIVRVLEAQSFKVRSMPS